MNKPRKKRIKREKDSDFEKLVQDILPLAREIDRLKKLQRKLRSPVGRKGKNKVKKD